MNVDKYLAYQAIVGRKCGIDDDFVRRLYLRQRLRHIGGEDLAGVRVDFEGRLIVVLQMMLKDGDEGVQFLGLHVGPFVQCLRRSGVSTVIMDWVAYTMGQSAAHGEIKVLKDVKR